ncbi:MAG: glycosyltransferase [Magnetococcales bacterium]|nr:glycosyltransferase [Magnetococcales bacterium]
MRTLERVLLVSNAPGLGIEEGLIAEFSRHGIAVEVIYRSDSRTFFDKYIIRTTNKLLHNLRIQPKSERKFEQHPLSYRNYSESNLIKKVAEYAPDLILLLRGHRRTIQTLLTIKERAKLYGWWLEGEEDCMEQVPAEIACFDWYFFLSQRCVEVMQEQGHPHTSYQHHVVNFDMFRPPSPAALAVGKRYDLCFVGKWSEKRQQYLEAALKVTSNIAVYGPKWRAKNLTNWSVLSCIKGNSIFGEALVALYRQSAIVINITGWEGGQAQKRSGMNMRVLEVPVCGAFLLTDTSIETENILTPGLHVGSYEDLADFQAKLVYYLAHPEVCARIAQAGMAHIREKNISYAPFVDRIMQIYQSGETLHPGCVRDPLENMCMG